MTRLYLSPDISVGESDNGYGSLTIYAKGEEVMLLSLAASESLAELLIAFTKKAHADERRKLAS